jgi:hypothetical protein
MQIFPKTQNNNYKTEENYISILTDDIKWEWRGFPCYTFAMQSLKNTIILYTLKKYRYSICSQKGEGCALFASTNLLIPDNVVASVHQKPFLAVSLFLCLLLFEANTKT